MTVDKWLLCNVVFGVFIVLTTAQEFSPQDYCLPDESCWPGKSKFDVFQAANPNTEVVLKGDSGWSRASSLTLNKKFSETPGAAVYVSSTQDVVAAVKFAQDNDLNFKVVSSGHEYIGRSIADGALQVIVSRMDSIVTDLSCPEHQHGCMTVGPGVLWIKAYEKADAVNRVIVGGSEPTVSVTGWMLGGGHSPISPSHGLGVDQVVELEMVTADLSVVTMTASGMKIVYYNGTETETSDTDLFWAVRGGGGNTYGVVTSIKYKLHLPPSKFTSFECTFSVLGNGKDMYRDVHGQFRQLMVDLPKDFGGYTFNNVICYPIGSPACTWITSISYSLKHWGAESENQDYFDRMRSAAGLLSEYQALGGKCSTKEYDSFYAYESQLPNTTTTDVSIFGSFISSSEYTKDFIDDMSLVMRKAYRRKEYLISTSTLLGGQTKNTSSGATAVNPLFRNALWSSVYSSSSDTLKKSVNNVFNSHVTNRGQYFSECDDNMAPSTWQVQFWGDNYNKLLTIKRKYDPDNFFTCKQCVGSSSTAITAGLMVVLIAVIIQSLVA